MKPRVLVVEDDRRSRSPWPTSGTEGFDADVAARSKRPQVLARNASRPDPAGRHAPGWRRAGPLPTDQDRVRRPDHHADRARREIDRIVGLELGADDYVASRSRLGARGAHARDHASGRGTARKGPIEIGPILGSSTRTVRDGERVELAAKEFDLLHMLMANAGDVIRARRSWTRSGIRTGSARRDARRHISWLRKKIEDDASGRATHRHRPRRRFGSRLPMTSRRTTPRSDDRGNHEGSQPTHPGLHLPGRHGAAALTVPLALSLRDRARRAGNVGPDERAHHRRQPGSRVAETGAGARPSGQPSRRAGAGACHRHRSHRDRACRLRR